MTEDDDKPKLFCRYYLETYVFNPKVNVPPDALFQLPQTTLHCALYIVGISPDGTRQVIKDKRPFSVFNREPKNRPRSERGFRLFADEFDQLYGPVHVIESSIAFQGAHCWIYQDLSKRDPKCETTQVHLDVEGAKKVRDALSLFIDEAEAGELVESAEPAEEEAAPMTPEMFTIKADGGAFWVVIREPAEDPSYHGPHMTQTEAENHRTTLIKAFCKTPTPGAAP
jgi:hypothetical protein